jgi:hypothetical protein
MSSATGSTLCTSIGQNSMLNFINGTNNTALGYNAGSNLINTSNNIMIGNNGVNTDSNTIRIGTEGTHSINIQSGIRDVTTVNDDAILVYIDSSGQLGTASSDRRLKKNITYDFGDTKTLINALKPCKYSDINDDGNKMLMGCVADEFKTVFPEYVVKFKDNEDDKDDPFLTVQYQYLPILLLKDHQRLQQQFDSHEEKLQQRIDRLEEIIKELTNKNV